MSSGGFRIGLVGSESTHCDVYLGALNVENRFPGVRITRLLGEEEERTLLLMKRGNVDARVYTCDAMADDVDGVIVAHRRGSEHLAAASVFAERGLPIFVEKPFTGSLSEAGILLGLAGQFGSRVTCHSVMPMQDAFVRAKEDRMRDGVVIAGPCDPESPWDGLRFYGIHLVEMFLALDRPFPAGVSWVGGREGTKIGRFLLHCEETGSFAVFELHVGEGAAFSVKGDEFHRIALDGDPYAKSVEAIVGFLRDGAPGRTSGELLQAMALLDAMERAYAAPGKTVAIASV